jgi:uncharacterized protein (DUF2126 family)
MGGEPTFNARDHVDAPEWNGAALGPTKLPAAYRLVDELRRRLAPEAAVLSRPGKLYPGESLPRWALDIIGRRDGTPLWPDRELAAPGDARVFAEALAARLGVALHAAYEDPWRVLQDEAASPPEVDAAHATLDDSEERRRLARVLTRGVSQPAGFVLPVAADDKGGWRTERWSLRRGELFLIPGDSPIGLRLPLRSLDGPVPVIEPDEPPVDPPDPRRVPDETTQQARPVAPARAVAPVRTALCVERRDGALRVFLPPLPSFARFCDLVAAVDATRVATGLDVRLEGYPPPSSPDAFRLAVTPDPGVLEVNIPPVRSMAEYDALQHHVFDAALHAGLHAEKYLLDGRMAGSGGGHHLTLGGATPLTSPFVTRPDLLASLVTFAQHHPSLAYLFAGLFVGPTSQAPRVDEARLDSLYELEIALARARQRRPDEPPWLGDLLFRHLLADMTGNTHRAEISIDKLFDPQTPYGRQGLIEMRAFEMPPHPRMVVAQMLLVRALVSRLRRRARRRSARPLGPVAARPLPPALFPLARSRGRPRPTWPPPGCRCPPAATGRSSSCAARSPASCRPATSRSRCATRSSPGTSSARRWCRAAPRASSTRRWSASRCGRSTWSPSATR